MDEIASDEVIDAAYTWLCERRQDYSANDDVWNVRWKWAEIKPKLRADLLAGTYRFDALRRIQIDEDAIDVWAALSALVLKAMAIVLARHLKPHLLEHCHHLETMPKWGITPSRERETRQRCNDSSGRKKAAPVHSERLFCYWKF